MEQEAAIEELVKAEAHSNDAANVESKACNDVTAPVDIAIEKMEKLLPLDETNDDVSVSIPFLVL